MIENYISPKSTEVLYIINILIMKLTIDDQDPHSDFYKVVEKQIGSVPYSIKAKTIDLGESINNKFITNDRINIGNVTLNGKIKAESYIGDGSALTNLTAANLTGDLPALDGSKLTGINSRSIFEIVNKNERFKQIKHFV